VTRLLLASDFDGTLAPIVDEPEAAALDPSAREFFLSLESRGDVEAAFLSGRDIDDLTRRTAPVRAWRSGSHGIDVVRPDGSAVRSGTPLRLDLPSGWEEAVRAEGLIVEKKRYSVALHWRTAPAVGRDHRLVEEFASWAEAAGLRLIDGRKVVEASLPGGSKIEALETLLRESGATRVVYAGDDLTDLPAIALAATRGRGLFVRSEERSEELPPGVETVGSIEELLKEFERTISSAGDPGGR
jgi:trehalose-phosphatase